MAKNCPGCGASMEYDPGFDALVCGSCGNIIDPKTLPDADSFYYDMNDPSEEPKSIEETLSEFEELTGEMYDCHVYTCSQCGGEVIVSGTEISTRCVYCGSTSVVFSRISQEHRPDYIIPFRVSKEEALTKLNSTLLSSFFVPRKFKKLPPECIRGIYIPYYTFDGSVKDTQQQQRLTGETVYLYDCRAEFRDLLVESCQALDDRSTAMLEPYYMNEAVDFDTSYLMGFYSNISDLSPRGAHGTAELKAKSFIYARTQKLAPHTRNKVIRSTLEYDLHRTGYALLPAWFITLDNDGTHYTYLVNGQTGKIVGAAPWNKAAVTSMIVASCIAVVSLLTVLYLKVLAPFAAEEFPDDYSNLSGSFVALVLACILFSAALAFLIRACSRFKHVWENLKLSRSLMTFIFSKKRQGGVK